MPSPPPPLPPLPPGGVISATPSSTEGSGGVPAVQCLLVHEHFTFREEGVGPVSLFQDHNGISQVAVQTVNPEVGLAGSPPPGIPPMVTVGAQAYPGKKLDRSEPILGVGLGKMKSPLVPLYYTVLSLNIYQQLPRQQPHPALQSLQPLPYSLSVVGANPL